MFTREGRLKAALKMKDDALGVFHEAKERLNVAIQRLHEHRIESIKIIDKKTKEIEFEKATIERTDWHINAATNNIVKINEIIQ